MDIMYGYFGILLSFVLVVFCEQPLTSSALPEECCLSSSAKICLQFDNRPRDFDSAIKTCKRNGKKLLSRELYAENKTCFEEYLRQKNMSVWINSTQPPNSTEPTGSNSLWFILNSSGVSKSDKNVADQSVMCTKQEALVTPAPNNSGVETPDKVQPDGNSNNGPADNKSSPVTPAPGSGSKAAPDNDPPDNSVNKKGDQPKSGEDNHLSVAVPVALATTAIVLTICCCTCVVCGVILYRKREIIIRSIRKMNLPDKGNSHAVDSVELTSTVNVRAKINPCRPSNEKYIRESRFLNKAPADMDNEIYSTVDTNNLYSNVDYLRPCPDQRSPSYYEAPLTLRLYDETSASTIRPPTYVEYVANQNSDSQKDSGRYVSDGLLYVTVDHSAHDRKTRPVKAKSEPHVEYLQLDFKKTGKLRKKKNKTLERTDPSRCRFKTSL